MTTTPAEQLELHRDRVLCLCRLAYRSGEARARLAPDCAAALQQLCSLCSKGGIPDAFELALSDHFDAFLSAAELRGAAWTARLHLVDHSCSLLDGALRARAELLRPAGQFAAIPRLVAVLVEIAEAAVFANAAASSAVESLALALARLYHGVWRGDGPTRQSLLFDTEEATHAAAAWALVKILTDKELNYYAHYAALAALRSVLLATLAAGFELPLAAEDPLVAALLQQMDDAASAALPYLHALECYALLRDAEKAEVLRAVLSDLNGQRLRDASKVTRETPACS
jgi:hypothetical protein